MNQGQQNNGQQRQFVEVSGGGDGTPWKPQANEKNGMQYDPNNPYNTLMGYYASEKEIPGKDNKPMILATIVTVDHNGQLGESFNVICDTVLADRLDSVPLGSFVCLSYKGRMHKKGYDKNMQWTQTNSYHNWYVAVDPNAIPYAQLGGTVRQQTTQAPAQQQTQQPVFNPQQGFGGQQQTFTPPAGNMQQNQTFNPPAQQQNTGFQQQGQPVFTPPAQTFQQPAQQPPVQQQQWTPPAQTTQAPAQQQTSWQSNTQNPPQSNPNVFGGNQMGSQSNDLPF